MKLAVSFVFAALVACASAQTTLTGQYTCDTSGDYQLCQDQWGSANGVGSQNSTLVSTSGDSITWSTTYTWADNENDVKAFANVYQTAAQGMTLAEITSAPTTYDWEYQSSSSGLRADVSYDIWTGTAAGDPASSTSNYEIMIWLSGEGGQVGAICHFCCIQPVGSVATSGISLAGYTWDLWSGPNSGWTTLSFVSADGNINSFSADLLEFFDYLIENESVSDTQVLQAIQSGTEAFTGTATLYVSSYSVSIST
ncbi:glycoside hydrolase family 12 protein [Laetiporus sulphureus 93-53]|uniref:Glycoside hydrolase family 12 protein n=1 Tax=Laetiporus sulphureus 93-53 TaxID=1314785 RepID=A0A165HWD6_9APHY|nr:glycoside hydrolase family 12 protein [Laetiporus sulphureus 93-53]KZT12278.1 glycoside hydrolase family 12 protein [Laetiporus sulphureus 93-53]